MSKDLNHRIDQHNLGKVISTKRRRPFTLLYTEEYESRIEAAKREKYLKSGPGHKFLKEKLAEVVPITSG